MANRNTIFPGSHQWANTFTSLALPSSIKKQPKPDDLFLTNRTGVGGLRSYSEEKDRDVSEPIRRAKGNNEPVITATESTGIRKSPEIDVYKSVGAIQASPWRRYQQLYKLQFGNNSEYITVAELKSPALHGTSSSDDNLSTGRDSFSRNNFSVVMIKSFYGPDAKTQLQSIRQIRHEKFLHLQELFWFENTFLGIFKFMPLSLHEMATGTPAVNEIRLASILGQLLEGLFYLEKNNLEHQELSCSNVLIDYEGNIKIWRCEAIVSSDTPMHSQALSRITMRLMQGYENKSGAVGIEVVNRWPLDSLAFKFLEETNKSKTAAELLKHSLLQLPWHSKHLQGLVSLTNLWSNQGYKYPA